MAGRVEDPGRRDNVAETIEQTFIELQAGTAVEEKRDSRDSGEAFARTTPRARRKGRTSRLDLADVFATTEAAGQMAGRVPPVEPDKQRPEQSSQRPARAVPRERRKGRTSRLDLADVFATTEAAGQLPGGAPPVEPDKQRTEQASERPARAIPRERRKGRTSRLDLADVSAATEATGQMPGRIPPVEPDNQGPEQSSERRQRLHAPGPKPIVRADSRHRMRAPGSEPALPTSDDQAPDQVETSLESDVLFSSAAPSATDEAELVQEQLGLARLDAQDNATLSGLSARYPEVNIFDHGTEIIILAELPGLDLKMLAVTSDGHGLTISGNRRPQPEIEGARCRWRERIGASFVRTLQLPDGLEFARATATYRNGILEIRAPKSQPAIKIAVR